MNLRGTGHRVRQRNFDERGAAAVEAAIVTPVVLALFFGIVEMGFLFKDYMAAAGAVRAGVRMASANPRTSTFAQDAADNVALTGRAMNLNDVQQMWVYQLDRLKPGSDKPVGFTDFSGCNVCVQFRWDAPTKKFVTTPNSAHPVLKDNWPASTQNACSSSSLLGPPDRIGVYLKLKHDGFTKFVFSSIYISEASIMRLEPMPVLTGCK